MIRRTMMVAALVAGCGNYGLVDEAEEVEGTTSLLTKCNGGVNGVDTNYCNDPACPCVSGESDCDSDGQCLGDLVCGIDNGLNFGFGRTYDVCVPAHCTNGVQDADETAIDCGGADCGTDCEAACAEVPASPAAAACTTECPCESGESDCNNDSQCDSGLVCAANIGAQFGFSSGFDVCVPPHCTNGVRDADETVVDCGGADCGSDCSAFCDGLPENGSPGHCTEDCPCPVREGECVGDSACAAGLICVADVGAAFGFSETLDVCLASSCTNGIQDGDEEGIDCGPTCVPCETPGPSTSSYGGAASDLALAVATDSAGNLVVAGRFRETANFGGTDLTAPGASTTWDMFVASYGPGGGHRWSRAIGGTGSEGLRGVAVDVTDTGVIALAGSFNATVDFGTGPISGNSSSVADAFVMVLEPNGATRWVQTFGGVGPDGARGVAIDGTRVVVTGSFSDSTSFGGATLTSAGLEDVFLATYDLASGNHLASQAFGGAENDIGYAVDAVDGDIYMTGAIRGAVSFGSFTSTPGGADDAFVVRTSSSLVPVAARFLGANSIDRGLGIAVDFSGNPVVVGQFSNTVDFTSESVVSSGSRDVFILSLTRGLLNRWLQTFGGSGVDTANAVAVDPTTRDVGVTGVVEGDVSNFPGGASTGFGLSDVFFVGYNRLGTVRGASRSGGANADVGHGVSLRNGFQTVVGSFDSAGAFSGTSLTSAGGDDAFVDRQAL